MQNLEYNLQKSCVTWFRLNYENKKLGLLISIPNEGRKSEVTGGRLKATGLATGAPDLFIIKKGELRILFIEIKTTHTLSKLSDAQKIMHQKLAYLGQAVFVIRTLQDFILLVNSFFEK